MSASSELQITASFRGGAQESVQKMLRHLADLQGKGKHDMSLIRVLHKLTPQLVTGIAPTSPLTLHLHNHKNLDSHFIGLLFLLVQTEDNCAKINNLNP